MAQLQDLREAITAASGALPLIPKDISPLLLEYVRKFAPLRYAFPRMSWNTDLYFFNQRNALPTPQFVTEVPDFPWGTNPVPYTNSNYVQKNFPIKHFQVNSDVSKFAQKVARVNGSLLNLEMEGATRAMGWLEENAHIYGDAQATVNTKRPQWDGLETLIGSANKLDATQVCAATTGVLSLSGLDALIDSVRVPMAANLDGDEFFFAMSPKMQSKMVQLTLSTTRVMLERRPIRPKTDGGIFGNPVVPDVTDPGIEVYYYRNIPIVLTSFLSSQGQMGTVSLSQSSSPAGAFTASVGLKYQVSAVTLYGESLASSEASITASATGNYSITLSWSKPTINDAFGNALPIISYRVYRSGTIAGTDGTSGTETLVAVVPAKDASDADVTSWTDLGTASTANSVYRSTADPDGVSYPNAAVNGNPNSQGMERIYLCSRNPEYCVVPVVNDLTPQILAPVNARSVQFAITGDQTLALRAPLFAAVLERVRYL